MDKKKEEGSLLFIILAIFGIATLIYFQVYKKDSLYYLKKNYALAIDENYNGVIEKKYVSKENHNSPTVKFSKGKAMGITGNFWGKMQVGDSISKVKGDSVIQVFRNGDKIILEIAPFYESGIERLKDNK